LVVDVKKSEDEDRSDEEVWKESQRVCREKKRSKYSYSNALDVVNIRTLGSLGLTGLPGVHWPALRHG
jgi:hypothetical protein